MSSDDEMSFRTFDLSKPGSTIKIDKSSIDKIGNLLDS